MTYGTTTRTTLEQHLEPRDESSSITLSGTELVWNTSSTRPANYTLSPDGLSLPSPERMIDGMEYTLCLVQDSTSSRTITWGTAFVWDKGENPTLSSSAGARDVFKFYSDGVNMYGKHFFKQDSYGIFLWLILVRW